MAIKVNGTTVVNDSRELQNIANLKTVGGQSILGTGDITVGAGDIVSQPTGDQFLNDTILQDCWHWGEVKVDGRVTSSVADVLASDVNLLLGNYFRKTVTTNITFTFSNLPTNNRAYGFILEVNHTAGTVGWPNSVKWPSDVAPTLTAGKTHIFVFVTDDGGTTWRGVANANYSA